MTRFHVDQNSVKTLAKDLRNALGQGVRHNALIKAICTALGWQNDVLMHKLKQFAEAARVPFPAIAVPTSFARDLVRLLSVSYGRSITAMEIEPIFNPDEDTGVFMRSRPSERIFGAAARSMVGNGWSVFPQEVATRRPGIIDNKMIRWNETHDLVNRLPDTEVLERWIDECSDLNVAVVLGPASGHAIVIDLDVTDTDLSKAIQMLAVKHFGYTPLRRQNFFPRIALVYRQNPHDPISRSRHILSDYLGAPHAVKQSVEVVSSGHAITMHGKHHKTGSWYR